MLWPSQQRIRLIDNRSLDTLITSGDQFRAAVRDYLTARGDSIDASTWWGCCGAREHWTLDGFLDGPVRSAYERALATTKDHTIITVLHAGRIKEIALELEIRNPAPFEPVPDDWLTESDRLRAAIERARWEATDPAQHERSEDPT